MAFDTKFLKQLSAAYQQQHISDSALKQLLALQYGKDSDPERTILDGEHPSEAANTLEMHSAAGQNVPKFSIIIATHNRVDMVCRCIDSILAQKYPSIEVVVVDDCSTDNTQEVLCNKYPSVRYERNAKNLGPGGTRQKGYNLSTGDYVIFVDDDDFYVEPLFFAKAAAIFGQHENVAMVCANSAVYDATRNELSFLPLSFCGMMSGKQYLEGFMSKYRKPKSTFPTVLRKTVLDKAGFRDMWMMNDTSIYLRTLCFGDVYTLPDWVGVYWVHASNIGKNLPHKYIIENLDEKHNIYPIAKKLFGKSMPQWYHKQLMITINHYLNSRLLSSWRVLSVLWWILLYGHPTRKTLFRETIETHRKQLKKYKTKSN